MRGGWQGTGMWCRRAPVVSFAALLLMAMVVTGPVSGAFGATTTTSTPVRPGPTSIVQLGDSIASGEGTLYGFTFDDATGKWTGPADPDPTWDGTYQDCHQSLDAYGDLLAKTYPKASFTQLACTGATFEKGIAGDWSATVPAEFGNWGTDPPSDVNAVYGAAKPDLVLVTLGADDVKFSDIATQCAEYVYYHPASPTQCTAKTPNGPDDVIKKEFTDYLPTLEHNLTTLAGWIEARGKAAGVVPKIVFTTYPDPLPSDAPPGGKNFCPDTWLFYNDQLTYLSSLVHVMDNAITKTIDGYAEQHDDENIAVADLANAYDGHQWCAKNSTGYVEPWAYGLSIYAHYYDLRNPNPAAFHPTPEGQEMLARDVEPVVARLFSLKS